MAITTAIGDIFHSFYELLSSILGAALAIVQSVINAVVGFVNGIFTLVGNVLGGLVDVAGGVGKFLAGNVVILSIGALAAFAYVRYTASGQQIASAKKKN